MKENVNGNNNNVRTNENDKNDNERKQQVETAFCGVNNSDKVAYHKKLLNKPTESWMASTTSMQHVTLNAVGMTKVTNGRMSKIGIIQGIVNGDELKKTATLTNVVHSKDEKCNLFSLTKMMCQLKWKLDRNNKSIWIRKREKKLLFDIKSKK